MAEQSSTAMVVLDDLSRTQLAEVAQGQATQIESLEQKNARLALELEAEKPLHPVVEIPLAGGSAYAAARADARLGLGGKLEAGIATLSGAMAVGMKKSSPTAAKAAKEVSKAVVSSMLGRAGHEAGLKDAAAAEAERLAGKGNGGA